MKRIIIGIILGFILCHAVIVIQNDMRLRKQNYALSNGRNSDGMFGMYLRHAESCKSYGKKAGFDYSLDYGIFTSSLCKDK